MLRAITLVTFLAACGGGSNSAPDAADPDPDAEEPDAPPDADPLASVQGTGLCSDPGCMQISSDVIEYVPQFELWADGATKKRWIQLPAGMKIDSTNMDRWVFPVGTKLWKEFTRDGVRVETRLIMKQLADDEAPNAWFFISYAWNATQDGNTPTFMAVTDANGTMHDIPNRGQCKDCRVLGFQAIQLDFASNLFDLEDLITMDLLTTPPTGGTPGNRFPIPGNASDRAALGYMHGNCGHCHNPESPNHDITPTELLLETTKLASLQVTPAFVTTVDVAATVPINVGGTQFDTLVVSGDADNSALFVRMDLTNNQRMPKIASEVTDPTGQTVLRAWIDSL
jgi:hypothetical protein